MKICMPTHIFPRHEGDYKGSFVYDLAASLIERGHEVHIVTPMWPGSPQWEVREGIAIHRFKHVGWRKGIRLGALRRIPLLFMSSFLLLGLFRTVRVVTKYNLDLIHAYWIVPGGLIGVLAGWLTGRPVVATAAGSDIHTASKGLVRPLVALTLAKLTAILAPGSDIGDRCVALGAKRQNVRLILGHAGIDVAVFAPLVAEAQEPDQTMRNPQSVLYVGNLSAPKRVDTIIRAMHRVAHRLPQAQLTVVGHGEDRQYLESIVSDMGLQNNVRFLGACSHQLIPEYMRECDIFVHCSENEGLPVAIMEALACGKPVIASRVGGIPDLIREGERGFLLPPDDVDGYAERMIALLSDRALIERMGKNARAFAEEYLAKEKILEQMETIYQEVTGRGEEGCS